MVVVLQLGHLILRGQHFYDAEIPVQGYAENGADGAGIIDVGRLGFGSKKVPDGGYGNSGFVCQVLNGDILAVPCFAAQFL